MLGSKKYFTSFRDQSGPVTAYLAWFSRKWLMRTSQENMALPWVWHILHSIFIQNQVIAPPCNLCSNRSRERLPNFWDLLIRLWNLKFGTRIILLSKPSGCQHETHIYYAQLTKYTVMVARQQAGLIRELVELTNDSIHQDNDPCWSVYICTVFLRKS